MQIEVGKKYVQRNGDIVECTDVKPRSALPIVLTNLTVRTSEGRYWTDNLESQYDIVKEYAEPSQPVQPVQAPRPHPCKELIEEYTRQYASGEQDEGWWSWYVNGSKISNRLAYFCGEPEDYCYEMTEKHPSFVPATLPVPVVARKYTGEAKRLVIQFTSEKEANQAVKYFDKLIADSKK